MNIPEEIDVVILGAGGAGCSAAINLHHSGVKSVIFSHVSRKLSKTYNAQGGIQAALGPEDSVEHHFNDTMKAGNNVSDPEVVRVLTENARSTIAWLADVIGVEFDKNGKMYAFSQAGGLSHPRILTCKGTAGESIAKPLWEHVDDLGIEVRENWTATSIKRTENGDFILTFRTKYSRFKIIAKSVIIATGGANPDIKKAGKVYDMNIIPDGIELAEKIGATVVNPSLMQYHPTGVVYPASLRRLRLPETMRGAGATLTNVYQNEFTDHLGTRGAVTQAIVEEVKAGRGVTIDTKYYGVWMNTPRINEIHGSGYLENRFPKIYDTFMRENHNINQSPVLVYPIVHYSLGGIQINKNSETSIPGLFAAGEVTWGVHGEDRLMGNSLLDIFVFGKIAGESAARYINSVNKVKTS